MPDLPIFLGNGTLNKHSGIDFKQLNFLAKLNENHSGEVTLPLLAPPSLNTHKLPAVFKIYPVNGQGSGGFKAS